MPYRRSKSGQEGLPEIREWLGSFPGCPGVVGKPARRSGSGRVALRRSGSGWEALLEVWECSGYPPGGPRVVGRLSRLSESGREALP